MKLYRNFLSSSLLKELQYDVKVQLTQPVFRTTASWPDNLVAAFSGDALITPVQGELRKRLYLEMQAKLDFIDFTKYDIGIMYQVWNRGSGISWHNDANHKMAFTIYLNDEWDYNNGGIFLYEDANEVKALCPTCNTGVLNDKHTRHMVTHVGQLIKEQRKSIQVWFD